MHLKYKDLAIYKIAASQNSNLKLLPIYKLKKIINKQSQTSFHKKLQVILL